MELLEITPASASTYIQRFDNEGYGITERAISKLFKTFPNNADLEDVLLKVAALNDLYNTNIYAKYEISRHIWELRIDSQLQKKSLDLVERIAVVTINGNVRRNYSFASKYCHFHFPKTYPIYDSYVDLVLWKYQKKDGFATFKRKELWNSYHRFVDIVQQFKEHYGLTQFKVKEIDKFLWLFGIELSQN